MDRWHLIYEVNINNGKEYDKWKKLVSENSEYYRLTIDPLRNLMRVFKYLTDDELQAERNEIVNKFKVNSGSRSNKYKKKFYLGE